jgi:hypothetical protein
VLDILKSPDIPFYFRNEPLSTEEALRSVIVTMGWFGSSGEDKSESVSSSYDPGGNSGFADVGSSGSAPQPRISAGGFEQDLAMEQQKAMVQAVMGRLTEMSFEACVSKPSTSLSSSEKSCIQAVTSKYLDASEFTVGRFSQSQQR